MRKPIIAGNWKMHKTVRETRDFVMRVKDAVARCRSVESVICAPFTSLSALAEAVYGSFLKTGGQNMHWEDHGAYTGEVSGGMLQELGMDYVIIGHSERRAMFAETDVTVNRKVHAAFRYGLKPIVCVGESLDERNAGKTREICRSQADAALLGLDSGQAAAAVIAYEPIWAIGSGRAATANDAGEAAAAIRMRISERFGSKVAAAVRIQYGGGVAPDNIGEFLRHPEIDGALIGGASLQPESFVQLLEEAEKAWFDQNR